MPYRADQEALRTRYETLQKRLAEVQAMARDLGDLQREEETLRRALGEVGALLEAGRSKSPLDDLRIAAPCSAGWADMTGDERVRFCGKCEKNVYNLSAMTRDQAEALVREKEGNLCVRFYQRADGTMITSDCPVGVQRRKVRRLTVLAIGAGVGASALAVGAGLLTTQGSVQHRPRAISVETSHAGNADAPDPPDHPLMGRVMMGAPSPLPPGKGR